MIMIIVFFLLLVVVPPAAAGCPPEKCGSFDSIPYPFRLDNGSDCGELLSDAFHLSCVNSTSLFVNIGSYRYQVLRFFPGGGGLLVVLANVGARYSSSCRRYYDLRSFRFQANGYFGISKDNLVGLYGCGDSSLCRSDCGGCQDANTTTTATFTGSGCCYSLSEDRGGVWRVGDSFTVFEEFGCKGFSSWVGSDSDSGSGSSLSSRSNGDITRGVKLEWAVPSDLIKDVCDSNARIVNASSVIFGMRCECVHGFVGDGFTKGTGCLKYCVRDGSEAYGKACYVKRHGRGKSMLVAGILALALSIATLIAFLCLLRRQSKPGTVNLDQNGVSLQKECRTRLFTHTELEQATNGFSNDQKLVNVKDGGTIYAGILTDGLDVAIHKVHCTTETDIIHVLSRIKILSEVSHTNMARILGYSIDSGYTPLVVYEHPGNGTLEQHLCQEGTDGKIGLDWHNRLKIVAQISSVLAYLQTEIFPPIFHHGLQSGCVLLDHDMSVKLIGFELLDHGSNMCGYNSNSPFSNKNDVCALGVVLLEILAGGKSVELATIALRKIRNGKVEEVVDPMLYYHEQSPYRKEQMGIVADVATRCLLFGGDDGRLGMNDVAKELIHVTKETGDHASSRRGPSGLEETFSNSSLLQMISLSPDSIYAP